MALSYFPELERLMTRRVGLLSGGEQQMLGLACKLVAAPKALMIDEMSMGLAPIVVSRLLPTVRRIADEGTAVLIVEQHVHAALPICDGATFSATAKSSSPEPLNSWSGSCRPRQHLPWVAGPGRLGVR